MNADDRARLQHILDAAKAALQFVAGKQRADLEQDLMLMAAVAWMVGIVGEAAGHLSDEFHQAHPEVPWPKIISMRNRLIHGYFDINLDILWNTALMQLPLLIDQINTILRDEPS